MKHMGRGKRRRIEFMLGCGDKVTLHPFLLGQRFQRAADRAILRKNGVTDTKKPDARK